MYLWQAQDLLTYTFTNANIYVYAARMTDNVSEEMAELWSAAARLMHEP